MNKKLIVFLFFLPLLCLLIVGKQQATALGNTYPDDGNLAFLSNYGSGHLLQTPNSKFRIFYKWDDVKNRSDPLNVRVTWLCRTQGQINVDFTLVQTGAKKSPSSCNFNSSYSFEFSFSKNKLVSDPGAYTSKWRYIDIIGESHNTASVIAFDIKALNGDGQATFREMDKAYGTSTFGNNHTINNYQNHEQRGLYTAFALWKDNPKFRDITIKFAASCDYQPGKAFLRWYDADQGELDQTKWLKFKLIDKGVSGNGNNVVLDTNRDNIALGGDDVYREHEFDVNKSSGQPHIYEWTWYDVDDSNGIQFWMPFSEIGTKTDCTWKLDGTSAVTNTTTNASRDSDSNNTIIDVRPGQGVIFKHKIQNNGPAQASFEWQAQGSYNGSAFGNGNNGRNSASGNNACKNSLVRGNSNNVDDGETRPQYSGTDCFYKFPNNAKNNDLYCQRIAYGNIDKPNDSSGNSGNSKRVCARYKTGGSPGNYACTSPVQQSPLPEPGDGTLVTFNITSNPRTLPAPNPPSNYTVEEFTGRRVGSGTASMQAGSVAGNWKYAFFLGGNVLSTNTSYKVHVETPDGQTCEGSINVFNLPWFNVVNGSIRTGGNFASTNGGDSVNASENGMLFSWFNTFKGIGSHTNLSTLSSIHTTGVASAWGRWTSPTGPTGLSFANGGPSFPAGNITQDATSPRLGGLFDGLENFYDPKQPDDAKPIDWVVRTDGLNSGSYYRNGDLELLAAPIGDDAGGQGKNIAIYVNGNVAINSAFRDAIDYASAAWAPNKAPSFTLVVTGGNIYIDPGIRELNGVYIAKRSGGKGGTIYTCSAGQGALGPHSAQGFSTFFDDCDNQLDVHGSFVADKINLMRTGGTLKDPNNAAEIFHYTPMMYFGKPVIEPPSNGALQYDAITSLPPVL